MAGEEIKNDKFNFAANIYNMKKLFLFQLLFVVIGFVSCNSNSGEKTAESAADTAIKTQELAAPAMRVAAIRPDCQTCENCNDASCIDLIVEHHSIDRETFYSLVASYYAGTDINVWAIPAPYVQTKDQIWTLIHGDDNEFCKTNSIKFFIDPDHPNTHTGMRLEVDNICSSACADQQHMSIALLKGVINKYHVTSFSFVRLLDYVTKKPTIGFIAYAIDTPVYYGDLTGDFP